MTRDDRTPIQPDASDDVDLLVSRRVDGEITPLDVPENLRIDVEHRVGVVSAVRAQLRVTADRIPVSESRISSALAAAKTSRATGRRIYSGRPAVAVAASFVFLVAASLFAVRQFDSGRDGALTEGINATAADGQGAGSPADTATTQDQTSLSDAASPEAEIASVAESTTVPEFATQEDVESFIASLAVVDSKSSPSGIDPVVAACGDVSVRPFLVRFVSLQGRVVEVQMFDNGGYTVYDVEDCSIVFERTSDDASAPPG